MTVSDLKTESTSKESDLTTVLVLFGVIALLLGIIGFLGYSVQNLRSENDKLQLSVDANKAAQSQLTQLNAESKTDKQAIAYLQDQMSRCSQAIVSTVNSNAAYVAQLNNNAAQAMIKSSPASGLQQTAAGAQSAVQLPVPANLH